jgi:SAM-dependent methyltransferase
MTGFPTRLIDLIRCPKDLGRLAIIRSGPSKYVLAGEVGCETCMTRYKIRDGILRLLPEQDPLPVIVQHEQQERDTGAQQYDAHFSDWAHSVELSAVLPEVVSGSKKTILDLACGTGRITTKLLPHADAILASDLSEESLRVLSRKLDDGANVGLIWSDATQLRIVPESVNLVVSTQLLEHIPSTGQRAKFLEGVHSALSKDGVFLLTVYYYSSLRRLLRRRQEGRHVNGIFYRRFTRAEIKKEFAGLFQIGALRPIQIDPRLLRSSLPIVDSIVHGLEKTFVRDLIGQLLFVKASKTVSEATN